MDAAQFNACVDSRKYKDDVDADVHAGEEVGVNGTPAFFINGRELTGAQPVRGVQERHRRRVGEALSRAEVSA